MPYIGRGSDGFGIRERYQYTATSGQTAFTGSDINSKTLKFDNGSLIDVLLNGVMLKPTTDYNTSTANTVTLVSGASTSDELMVIVYDVFTLSDALPKSGGTVSGALVAEGGVTFNEGSNDVDFRVESNGNASTLIVDGGLDRVQIKTNSTDAFDSSSDDLIIGTGTGHNGMSIYSGSGNAGVISFAQGTTGTDSYNGYIQYEHNNDRFTFGMNNAGTSKAIRFLSSGNIEMVGAGQGIDFSVTNDADSTAGGSYTTESEVLDDYEEGRFTPYLHATNVTFGYHHNYGNYTKVGQMVHFTIYFGVSSASGTTTNQAYVWGLPYVCYNGTASGRYSPAVTIGSWYNCDIDTHFPTAYIDPNTEIIKLVHAQDAGVPTAVTADDVSSGFIYLSGSYRVT